jgi:hypothetical protein
VGIACASSMACEFPPQLPRTKVVVGRQRAFQFGLAHSFPSEIHVCGKRLEAKSRVGRRFRVCAELVADFNQLQLLEEDQSKGKEGALR